MAKKVERPKEPGAPAYMAQYTALMMLLLAFFIAMLANAGFGEQHSGMQQGLGIVRDSLGLKGGLGILPFISQAAKTLHRPYPRPELEEKPDPERVAIGHPRKSMRTDVAVFEGFLSIKQERRGFGLRIAAPVVFPEGGASLDAGTKEYIERIGGIMLSMPDVFVTLRAWCAETNDPRENEMLAGERSAAVMRYLERQCRVPRSRVRSAAYVSTRYLGELSHEQNLARQALFLYMHKRPKS